MDASHHLAPASPALSVEYLCLCLDLFEAMKRIFPRDPSVSIAASTSASTSTSASNVSVSASFAVDAFALGSSSDVGRLVWRLAPSVSAVYQTVQQFSWRSGSHLVSPWVVVDLSSLIEHATPVHSFFKAVFRT